MAASAVVLFAASACDGTSSAHDASKPVHSAHFDVLPVSMAKRSQVALVQLDDDRVLAFGGMSWDDERISVAHDGVLVDFAAKTSAALDDPALGDGLTRAATAVSGNAVLFFGIECKSGRVPSTFDGEGDRDACPDGPLVLVIFDVATGTWSKPVSPPSSVGGDAKQVEVAFAVGDTAVVEWYQSDDDQETYTAYDIPSGQWRALDRPAGAVRDLCATRDRVVRLAYEDGGSIGARSYDVEFTLLDPTTDRWTIVRPPNAVVGAQSPWVECTTNDAVVQAYVVPGAGTTSFDYRPATKTWRLLPASPRPLLQGPSSNGGSVLVNRTLPGKNAVPDLTLQTLDLSRPDLRWSTRTQAPSVATEFAWGVQGKSALMARVENVLYRIVVQ
jgi:hypothetical protein